jgi:POT family proton-dependent oligopeptide transporter
MTDAAAVAPAGAFPATAADRTFLGHPRGLAYLAFTEAWERFSFYGMSGLLLLYMVQSLLLPGNAAGVIGLAALRSGIERIAGPLSDQAFASQIYGLYSGLVYFTPVFGGMLADRLLRQRRTVMLGAVLMSAGHLLMAVDAGFLVALVLLIVGCGCLKGNISAQVGHLYPLEEEGRRTRAFAIFSAAINVGGIAGPLVCGITAQVWGWHVGFGVAGILMLAGLATYVAGWRYLPPDRLRSRSDAPPPRLNGQDWRVIAALLIVALIAILPATAYYQETNSVLLFIDASVDSGLFGWTVPTATYMSLDGIFCILVVPPLVALWRWQGSRGREPGDMAKIAIGYAITALGNLLMMVPAGVAQDGGRVSAGWPILLFALNALGFMFYWPTLLAMFSRAAPAAVNGTMMGLLFFSTFLGNLLVGILGALWERMPHAEFFALHAALAFVPCLLMLLVARPVGRILAPKA